MIAKLRNTAIITLFLPDENASVQCAKRIAASLSAPLVLTFSGEIGSGKTTLIRAMLRTLGVSSAIKSPTFSLVESYECANMQIHHMDLYRIVDVQELEDIGFRDYFVVDAICCIEWPRELLVQYTMPDINFTCTIKGTGRELVGCALTQAGAIVLSYLMDIC